MTRYHFAVYGSIHTEDEQEALSLLNVVMQRLLAKRERKNWFRAFVAPSGNHVQWETPAKEEGEEAESQ